jgi:predicted amidohydrolase
MTPAQKILNGHASVKVAVVQSAPVFFDRPRTIDKACEKIAEAAREGAQVIVFSESWITGYPYWGEGWESRSQDWRVVRTQFFDNALIIPSEDTARLCDAAAQAGAVVVMGCNELDSDPASQTIYNTLLYIDNHGRILGRHRKIMPTFVERAVWGAGDGADLRVYATDFGRIGGLICGENLMTLARAHMISQGEDFHVAVFPGAFSTTKGPRLEELDEGGEHFWGYPTCRSHAREAGAFVVASCGYITRNDIPADFPLADSLNIDYAQGGSAVYMPSSLPAAAPAVGDRIIYAVCAANAIKLSKAIVDTMGHYARPDIFGLEYRAKPYQHPLDALDALPAGELERIADRHGVASRDIVASIVEPAGARKQR